jgi:hypothetical protein
MLQEYNNVKFSVRYLKIDMLSENLISALGRTCPVKFNISRTCPTINCIGVAVFTRCADRQVEVCDRFAIQIPDDANGSVVSIRMYLERNIDILAGLERGSGL